MMTAPTAESRFKIRVLPLLVVSLAAFAGVPVWSQEAADEDLPNFEEEIDATSSVVAPEEERPVLPPPAANLEAHSSPASSMPTGKFVMPKAPPGGGTVKTPHPNAAKGLLKIDRRGIYQYKTRVPEKSAAASMQFGYQTTPQISSDKGFTFADMYGTDGVVGLVGSYEWQPFRRFGSLGLSFESGLTVARGNGRFSSGEVASEIYTMVIVPANLLVVYRFEYMRRQWVVPFIEGGGGVYGMAEVRDDGKKPTLAAAPAAMGGGGIHINLSRFDPAGAFVLAQEYSVADMWLTIRGRVIQGLNSDLDISSELISAGFTVDF